MARTGYVGRKQGKTAFDAIDLEGGVLIFTNAGAPSNGAAGTQAGKAGIGSICIDRTNGKAYINTGTLASPTWTVVGSQS